MPAREGRWPRGPSRYASDAGRDELRGVGDIYRPTVTYEDGRTYEIIVQCTMYTCTMYTVKINCLTIGNLDDTG